MTLLYLKVSQICVLLGSQIAPSKYLLILKKSSRRLQDMSWILGISVSSKSKCLSGKSIIHKDESKMHQLEPNNFNICLVFELKNHLYLKSLMTVWCCEISWIQIRLCRAGEAIKRIFKQHTTQTNSNELSLFLTYLYSKNIFRLTKSFTFANLLMEKPGIDFLHLIFL